MIIHKYHEREGHAGVTHVLSAIRERYWIIQGGASIRRVLSRCVECKALSAVPIEQIMPLLPEVRVKQGTYSFEHVGLDYFGPIAVRVARHFRTWFGCIVPCLRITAIHLEV
ncbi:hypothetical protein H7673_11110, partial [Streptococcus dysgalactiae subsp. equisimilis]|nr:hypothetical protein [Streptococcus dysgalactiae subsp. equisimilis]